MAKKIGVGDIDEEFIISSFKQDSNLPSTIPEKSEKAIIKDTTGGKESKFKNKSQNYQDLFLKEATIPARIGKSVSLRQEFHERIQKIVRVIAGDEISIYSYVDNVLAQHFLTYKEEITELYNQKDKSIF